MGGEDDNEVVPASRRQVEIVCEMKPRSGGWVMMKKLGAMDLREKTIVGVMKCVWKVID